MARQNLHLGAELKEAVAQALRNGGYRVVEDGNAGPIDAVLDIRIDGASPPAFQSPLYASHGGDFEPEFFAVAKLTDSKTKNTLFFHTYIYRNNSIEPIKSLGTLIRPDSKYAFKTSKAPFENPQLAAEGFRAAEPLIAQGIASTLKKP
jgi:hypothetical protein